MANREAAGDWALTIVLHEPDGRRIRRAAGTGSRGRVPARSQGAQADGVVGQQLQIGLGPVGGQLGGESDYPETNPLGLCRAARAREEMPERRGQNLGHGGEAPEQGMPPGSSPAIVLDEVFDPMLDGRTGTVAAPGGETGFADLREFL